MANIPLKLKRGYGYFQYGMTPIDHDDDDSNIAGLVRFSQRPAAEQGMLSNGPGGTGPGLAVIYTDEL